MNQDHTAAGNTHQTTDAFLSIQGVSKRFDDGTLAVDEVSLDIPKGAIYALLGSSGSGKSTLLRMLAGFETPTEGRVLLNGRDITDLPPYRRPLNMMFQSYALFPHLSVWDNIAFGLRRMGMKKDMVGDRVEELLRLVQLSDYAQRKPDQLSGGQQQRVALARSLARKPQLLLLDEPLGALDKKLREQTQFELVNIIESVGVTCLMVTHDQEEAMTMADQIAVMSHGQIMQLGTPKEVYEAPNCRFVAEFIGTVNVFDGELVVDENDHCEIQTPQTRISVGHGVTGSAGMQVSAAIRPEKIFIGTTPPDERNKNIVQGVIEEIGYMGSYNTYQVQLPDGMMLKIHETNTDLYLEGKMTWGDTVYCWWNDQAAVVLRS